MSSRITTPVSKLARSISSTASVARPSHLLNNGTKVTSASNRIRQPKVTAAEDAPAAQSADYSTSTTTTLHRPTPTPSPRKMPLMQGFRTSAPKPARHDASHIDFAVFPDLRAQESGSSYDPYANIRVPLLPDLQTAPGIYRTPEAVDAPLPAPEISVVAANPDVVLPAALTEVEGMGVDGVELRFAHDLGREPEPEPGMLKDIWRGLVEDVFGSQNSSGSGTVSAA